jgi:hypothetical protein
MDLVLQEKHIIAGNHEEDTKKILFRMLKYLREIKGLKQKLSGIEEMKLKNDEKESELVQLFRGRK